MLANIKITMIDERGVSDSKVFNVEAPTVQGVNDVVLDELSALSLAGYTRLSAKRTMLKSD